MMLLGTLPYEPGIYQREEPMTWKSRYVLSSDDAGLFLGTLSNNAALNAKIVNMAIGFKIFYPVYEAGATASPVSGVMNIPGMGTVNLIAKI